MGPSYTKTSQPPICHAAIRSAPDRGHSQPHQAPQSLPGGRRGVNRGRKAPTFIESTRSPSFALAVVRARRRTRSPSYALAVVRARRRTRSPSYALAVVRARRRSRSPAGSVTASAESGRVGCPAFRAKEVSQYRRGQTRVGGRAGGGHRFADGAGGIEPAWPSARFTATSTRPSRPEGSRIH